MAGNGALDLSIRIVGKVDPSLAKSISQVKGLTNSLSGGLKGTNSIASTVANTMGVIGKTGLALAATLTGTVAVGIKSVTSEAAKLEAQMAPVMRYVDGLADSTGKASNAIAQNGKTFAQNYSDMENYIQRLSTEIPRTTEQITTMSAALGQSGKGVDEQLGSGILRDTAVAATAMDLDDQTAGDYMAKWEVAFTKKDAEGNKVNYSHDDVMRLMNQINYLGANNATTAAEIASSVNKSASIGQLAGVDPSTTAAIATAMQATGVDTERTGTTISRIYTNISKGSSATKAQKEMWEELGFTATGVASSMQKDGTGTLLKVFGAINQLPDERKIAALNTLFNQWAVEGGAKVTNNLDLLLKTLSEVSDPAAYSNSMEREFAINTGTQESLGIMRDNARTVLMQDAGEQFLPAQKELTRLQLDLYKSIDDSLPDLSNLVMSVMPLLRSAVEGIGKAAQAALPWVQKGIDYTAEHGPQVAGAIAAIIAAFGAMSIAPKVYSAGSTLMNVLGNTVIGGKPSGAPGGTFGGISIGNLMGLLSPTSLFQNAVSGGKSLWGAGKAAAFGAGLANSSMTQAKNSSGSFLEKMQNAAIGAIFGLKNQKGLTGNSGNFWKNVLGTANQITAAKNSGGLLGMLKSSGVGSYASNVGQSLLGLKNSVVGFGSNNPVGRLMSGVGNVTGQILSGIVGPNGIDIGGIVGGLKAFAGAGKTVIGDGLSSVWQSISQSKAGSAILGAGGKAAGFASKVGGGVLSTAKGALNVGGAGLNALVTTVGPVAGKLGGGFMSLLGMFGPAITSLGTMVAVVSLLGDHFEDIRGIVGTVFGEGGLAVFDSFTAKIKGIGDTVSQVFSQLSTPEGLQSIQQKLSSVNFMGFNMGDVFSAAMPAIQTVMPLIQSFADVFGQIVDLGVNHIKPVLVEIFEFVINEGIPAVMPLLSTVVSLVGTTLVNAVKTVVDIVGKLLPVVEPVVLGIIGFLKQIATIGVKVVNFIIGALNKIQLTIPETLFGIPIPLVGGKSFGFNLSPVALPQFANGGFTSGPSIAGEAGTEAIISFRRSQRDQNVDTWMQAGKMLGVPLASALFLGSDAGVAFSRTTELANYAADALESAATSGNATAQKVLGDSNVQKVLSFVRKADVAQAKLSYAANPDNYDLSNVSFFPTAGDAALTRQNLAMLENLKDYQQEVTVPSIGSSKDDSGSVGNYQRSYTSSGGSTYVYAPNFTIYGSMDAEDLRSLLDEGYERFCQYVEQYERERKRKDYGT